MSDEIPVVTIGGLHRIAFDRRPPASRQTQRAINSYAQVQPHHQRVRIHDALRLGHSLDDINTNRKVPDGSR